VRTVGVVSEDPERGLVLIAKPVGVVAALIPTTGPDATPPVKTLFALKGRNAIICFIARDRCGRRRIDAENAAQRRQLYITKSLGVHDNEAEGATDFADLPLDLDHRPDGSGIDFIDFAQVDDMIVVVSGDLFVDRSRKRSAGRLIQAPRGGGDDRFGGIISHTAGKSHPIRLWTQTLRQSPFQACRWLQAEGRPALVQDSYESVVSAKL